MRFRESVLEVSFTVVDNDILTVLAGMFAVDCVLCRTVSQLFAHVLVPCISNWCNYDYDLS